MIPSIANIRKAIYCLNKRIDQLEGGDYQDTMVELSNKISALESLLDDDAQNPTKAIDKFNEIVAFLDSIDNTETLQELLRDVIQQSYQQNYVTVPTYASLPATGSADTIYRVSNYNGSTNQIDTTSYSEYVWDNSDYTLLCVKSQMSEVFDISAYHATGSTLAKYTDLTAALDSNNGGGVPQSFQKGGMRIQFVRTSDNKYVQARLMAQNFTTDVTQWQGVDDEPTVGSKNLITSGGVEKEVSYIGSEAKQVLRTHNVKYTYNSDTLKNGLLSSSNGKTIVAPTRTDFFYCEEYFAVTPGDVISVHAWGNGTSRGVCFYDKDKNYISGLEELFRGEKITIPNDVYYFRICTQNRGITGLGAELIPITEKVYNISTVDDLLSTLRDNETNYNYNESTTIYLSAGVYDFNAATNPPLEKDILIMPNTKIIGFGRDVTILRYNYTGDNDTVISRRSVLNTPFPCLIENLTIEAKNIHYAVHSGGADPDYGRGLICYNNVHFIHHGFNDGITPSHNDPYAFFSGIWSGEKIKFEKCIFEADTFGPFFCHNQATTFSKPYSIDFYDCEFISHINIDPSLNYYKYGSIILASYGTGNQKEGFVSIHNCKMDSAVHIQLESGATQYCWNVDCDNNQLITYSYSGSQDNIPSYSIGNVRIAKFANAALKGTPVTMIDSHNGSGVTNSKDNEIFGILLTNVSSGDSGYIATEGSYIPTSRFISGSYTKGTLLGYSNGSWVEDTENPLLVIAFAGWAKVLGTNTNKDIYKQINVLSSDLDNIKSYFRLNLDLSDNDMGLLLKHNGSFRAFEDSPKKKTCLTYFSVKEGQVIKSNMNCAGSFATLCYYNSNKGFLSAVEGDISNGTTVPQGVSYMRLCTERYNETEGIWAYIDKEKEDPDVTQLQQEMIEVQEIVEPLNPDKQKKNYFGIDRQTWISDETVKYFYPSTQKVEQDYKGEVNSEKRYIALGFDDFRATDFSLIIPLLEKYGARAEFNRVHNSAGSPSLEDIQRINSVINGRHELGDHTWKHYKYPFDEPLFNGQDPSSVEGAQVPFPSNDQLRNDAGDGKNVFGRTLTNNVKTDLGYQAPDINTTWAAMTDEQCQQLRDYYSVMKDTSTNLVVLLDTLSNTYLGTTGSSRGSWDSVNGEYTGGIFTGCKTSQNHEIWERILLVTNMFLKDKFGLNYNLITWSLPGSKDSGCTFPYNGVRYYDSNHTKRVGNLARFASSLYKNNDGTNKERSWTDVLREFGYRTTHDANPPSRDTAMMYQFIMNAYQSRKDALIHPTNRLLSYSKMASEYTKGTDLTGTAPYEVQMYDGGANSNKNLYRNEIEQWRHSTANGIIWGAVIDSNDTWSERMILEGLLKYGTSTGIEFITHAEAFDICFNHQIKSGNLIYNPRLRNTAKEFMPTATSVPSNPDGYQGDCSVTMVSGVPVLTTTGSTSYFHYGVPYGKLKFSADVKGSGTITIKAIKNSTPKNTIGTSSELITTISISSSDFEAKTSNFEIVDNGVTAYEDVFGGYGNKIIGLYIEYSAGLQVKNIDLRTV